MIHYVKVAVALSRPPKIDEWRRYCVVAATRQEAELIAQQMAACTSVMPVESQWESSHRAGPTQPFGALGCMCWNVAWADDVGDDEQWQIHGRCPYHSDCGPTEPAECPPGVHSMYDFCPGRAICEDGWEEPVDHGIRSAECEAGTCDCDGFIPPTADRLMEVQGVMGSIAGCPACAEHGECLDCQEARENPPTSETANAGGPDTDDTTATTSLPYVGLTREYGESWPGAYARHLGERPATGAIVPDELKRKPYIDPATTFGEAMAPRKITLSMPAHPLDTVKVSCTCAMVDVSTFSDFVGRQTVRGRTDGDCPAHGDLAQIRAFGHIDVGDRLRVNDFGVWSITRPGDLVPGLLSPGSLVCSRCDDWSFTLNGDTPGAYRALSAHWAATTEDGTHECPRSPSQRRPTWRTWLKGLWQGADGNL